MQLSSGENSTASLSLRTARTSGSPPRAAVVYMALVVYPTLLTARTVRAFLLSAASWSKRASRVPAALVHVRDHRSVPNPPIRWKKAITR